MKLDEAIDLLKRALTKQKEYDSGKVTEDLIIEGKNYKGWILRLLKMEK